MRGKTFPDRIEVFIKPEEVIFAPAPKEIQGKLMKTGIAIGSLISWFAWAWLRQKHPKIIRGKEKHSMKLEWNGEQFVATFQEDIPA